MLVVLMVVIVVLSVVILVLVKGNQSLKRQYKEGMNAANMSLADNANIIIGLQEQIDKLLIKRADDKEDIGNKQHHINCLVKDVATKTAALEQAFDEAFALKEKAESFYKEKINLENEISSLKYSNESLKNNLKTACETSDEFYKVIKELSEGGKSE